MSFLQVKNVRIAGVCANVPEQVVINDESSMSGLGYKASDFVHTTGVAQRHVSQTLTTSDLCYKAALRLLDDLSWEKDSIDCLVFLSQTQDYFYPATSCILQDRLGLSKKCFCEDLSLGCSGWVYGLATTSSLLQTGDMKRALLMVGDAKRHFDADDPLFGFAGTVTALEFCEGSDGFMFLFGTDGSGYSDIIIPDGGARNPITLESFQKDKIGDRLYSRLECRMNGMNVFLFGSSVASNSIREICQHYNQKLEDIDYVVLHQANKKMLSLITKRLKLQENRVPICIDRYGNTSSASIPLTLVSELSGQLVKGNQHLACCGFGVGLSWGCVLLTTDPMVVSGVLTMKEDEAYYSPT